MSKKHVIKPKTAMSIFSLIVAITMVFIVMLMNHFMMAKVNTKLELQLKQTYKEILRGYSEAVSTRIQNYFFALDGIDISIFQSDTATEEEKLKYLNNLNKFKHPDFYQIYYCEANGKAWLLDGTKIDVHDRDYYKNTVYTSQYNYISNAFNSRNTNQPIVMLTRSVKDDSNRNIGFLCASITLSKLQTIFSTMDIGRKDDFALHDNNGIILANSNPDLLFKIYKPSDPKYSMYGTDFIANLKEGVVKSSDIDNEKIFILFEPVKNSAWVVGIKIPETVFTTMQDTQHLYENLALIISTIAIFILIFLELKVMDFFQKKQLIASTYDNLTGLWTRQMFESESNKLIKRHSRSKFLFIESDISGFKFINQNYGERSADNLVVYFAEQLKTITAKYNGLIGRAFADHIYIFIEISSVRRTMQLFRKELKNLNEIIKCYEIPFFPKFGLAFILSRKEAHETSIQTLIGNATFAKSTIKENYLDQFAVYNSHLLKKVINERYIESHMESALENEEFFVMYQPKIKVKTDELVGAEALVRWNSPKLGIVTPDKFIPLFERNGFIKKLDFYVYDKVFRFIRERLDAGAPIVPISVNMSRNHNKPDKFIHEFMEVFNKYDIPANLVQVEILERSVMDRNTLREITELLHKEGFTVAMDDFGSGESSLNMLTKIPVDVLKFDRTFLTPSEKSEDGTGLDAKTKNFIESLIKLGKNLDKETLFEGVETEEQRDFLKQANCDEIQGYFYSKPLREYDFINYIRNNIKTN